MIYYNLLKIQQKINKKQKKQKYAIVGKQGCKTTLWVNYLILQR